VIGRRAVLLVVLASCRPNLGPDDSLVASTRILAVRADPPEAKPGTRTTFTALVANPRGTETDAPIVWRWCVAPKPLAENNVVSAACLDGSSLTRAGTGASIEAAAPSNGCALFGPDTPPGGFRPRDADLTGGYYQPLRGDLAGAPPAFALARLLCDLAAAPPDVASQFAQEYVPNANPHLQPLGMTVDGAPASLHAIPPGARVHLGASWPAGDAETYESFDPGLQTLTTRRESMRVAWYASGGTLDTESTGRAEDDSSATTDNDWIAPQSGTVYLWLVLRDSRGGVDFADYRFDVAR
jgi:hypothetical protein